MKVIEKAPEHTLMRTDRSRSRTWIDRRALLFGISSGALWGFLAASAATPPEWLIYDQASEVVHIYLENGLQSSMAASAFFAELNNIILKVILAFLALTAPAGWATWQISRVKPRGQDQPPLRKGLDWYLIGLAIGGLMFVGVFRSMGWAVWFKGSALTPARWLSVGLSILLPLYMGVSLFFVWFLRLKSIKAPDWDTHYPKRERIGLLRRFIRLFERR